ncbi:MAG: hypothetical protein DRJ42_04630 [Deltaproteobacteria bacterium]|nr:MAG: hypothetical protein DRJ42_04630 [Deltaproteobacteria bacterium]
MAQRKIRRVYPEGSNGSSPADIAAGGCRRVIQGAGAFVVAAVVLVVLVMVNALGGTNPHTPPGHEGYVAHQPLAFGQREFVGIQAGPTSTGWAWRQYVTNIDMRPATWSEQMHIFAADNLEVSFEAHARIRLRGGSTKEVVERFSGNDWYAQNVARPYKTAVREVVRGYDAFQIKDESEEIAVAIMARLTSEYEETPFEFLSVSIGNIDYPDSVEERVVANLAAEQRRQRMVVQQQIAEQQAIILQVRARGASESQEIEQETLTPLYVQHEAAELYRTLADETDDEDGVAHAKVILVIPTRADRAGVPRIYQGN